MQGGVRIESTPDGLASILFVRAQPGSRRRGVVGAWNGMLKVAVPSPPEDGRANEDVARTLAEALGLRASAVRLVAGERSRGKRFRIEVDRDTLASKLALLLATLP